MPPRPDAATLGAEPARATKPSARLAQITVPSMAQSVASTAAKASYTQTMSPSVLTPPPLVAIKKDPKLANNWKTKAVEELTDAEVLAMPDSEYMNEKQMAFFRLKLAQLKQDILNSAGETTEHLREDTVIVPDPADRATIEEEHALELRTRDRERKLLKKIEQSIARIDAGDYGYCDETGEPIGVGRLLARPDRHAVARGAAAPRAQAEDVRGLSRTASCSTHRHSYRHAAEGRNTPACCPRW